MKRQTVRYLCFLVALIIFVSAGCGGPQPQQATPPAPQPSKEKAAVPETGAPQAAQPQPSLPTSETAARSEAVLQTKAAGAVKRVLPPDHWLVGTSKAEDMFPAVIAPEAPRKLLGTCGPAYLEQIGDTRVLHLSGSYRDMGMQHGTLLKKEILEGAALISMIGKLEQKDAFSAGIADAWKRTSPFIPEKFKEEIRGMAEATGLSEAQVQEFTIFPELFHCSGFAVWGKATTDGALYHGRVLDYMRDAGLDKFAVIIVQQPEGANAFVNVGYSGTIGSVTGMNAKQVVIGEMGGKGQGKWDGVPMNLLVRDCLERGNTLEEVRDIMKNSKRTCEYYYVISDAKANGGKGSALGVAAEPDNITFIGPNESHPRLPRPVEDTVLLSADERYNCLVDRVQKVYGKIDPGKGLDIMARGVAMKSNMHDALFKPATLEFWVTNSTIDDPACNRAYTHYDLNRLMKEKPTS